MHLCPLASSQLNLKQSRKNGRWKNLPSTMKIFARNDRIIFLSSKTHFNGKIQLTKNKSVAKWQFTLQLKIYKKWIYLRRNWNDQSKKNGCWKKCPLTMKILERRKRMGWAPEFFQIQGMLVSMSYGQCGEWSRGWICAADARVAEGPMGQPFRNNAQTVGPMRLHCPSFFIHC